MSTINFFCEDVSFELPSSNTITNWLKYAITTEGYDLIELNYIFCSDEYLHKVNIEYLEHDYYTDIITFDNSEESQRVEGDIFISIDRVRDNAVDHGIPFLQELQRVIIHGVLHLVGYNDKTDTQQKQMTEKENAYLSLPKFQL
ncbi:MAG: rRNA maturation RNase YbeY [Reichenbachiella sp.]|uniref:rRNA maturation RNase YbeY n=1 Tax=Reichenbachiella sp. TaxID=2184521 RepID=UPI003264EEBD